jgi:hypothetical protein
MCVDPANALVDKGGNGYFRTEGTHVMAPRNVPQVPVSCRRWLITLREKSGAAGKSSASCFHSCQLIRCKSPACSNNAIKTTRSFIEHPLRQLLVYARRKTRDCFWSGIPLESLLSLHPPWRSLSPPKQCIVNSKRAAKHRVIKSTPRSFSSQLFQSLQYSSGNSLRSQF